MFNWLKKLFCKPQNQSYTIIEVLFEAVPLEKPQKRKCVKSGKYVCVNKKGKKNAVSEKRV